MNERAVDANQIMGHGPAGEPIWKSARCKKCSHSVVMSFDTHNTPTWVTLASVHAVGDGKYAGRRHSEECEKKPRAKRKK